MKHLLRFVVTLMLTVVCMSYTFSATAITNEPLSADISIEIKTFVEDSYCDMPYQLSPGRSNFSDNFIFSEGDINFFIITHISGDIFYDIQNFEQTEGIKSVEYSIYTITNDFSTDEEIIPATLLNASAFNKVTLSLDDGTYLLTIKVTSIAEGYRNLFYECTNPTEEFNYYFSVNLHD